VFYHNATLSNEDIKELEAIVEEGKKTVFHFINVGNFSESSTFHSAHFSNLKKKGKCVNSRQAVFIMTPKVVWEWDD